MTDYLMGPIILFLLLAITATADADTGGRSPLMAAVARGDLATVERLLAARAPHDAADTLGDTALHLATSRPAAFTDCLIAAGAPVDARNAGGVSVLMRAAGAGRTDIVDRLLAAGARLDFRDYQGSTAADWARRAGHEGLARTLAARIADLPDAAAATGTYDFAEDVFVDVEFPPWFKRSFLDLDVDLEEALVAGKQGIMLFVSTSRCSYCKAFIDKALGQADIRDRLAGAFDVIGLEIFDDSPMTAVDGGRYRVKDFVTAMKAQFTPTLIFYGEGGRRLLKIVGYYPPDRFRVVLDYLEGGHYKDLTLREYVQRQATESADTGREAPALQAGDELFARPPHILDRRAAASGRPLMVLFDEPGCAPCHRFHRKVLGNPAVRRLLGQYEVRRLEIADARTPVVTPGGKRLRAADWYRELGLTYAPAVVLFDRRGREAMRIDSETLPYRMEGTLQLVLEDAHRDDAQLQRWRRTKVIEVLNAPQGR